LYVKHKVYTFAPLLWEANEYNTNPDYHPLGGATGKRPQSREVDLQSREEAHGCGSRNAGRWIWKIVTTSNNIYETTESSNS